ncbi:MAG: hypothetical protein EON96_06275 [Caulobacteraceae bacterium]|nr:MAG: hypothetical protein EON96_06275 [Caulobacteraceae bacterium]
MAGKSDVPYLPLDLERLEMMNSAGKMLVGEPGGMVVVRCRADDPDGEKVTIEDGYAYLREMVRLARIGQRIERETAAIVARNKAAEPRTQ